MTNFEMVQNDTSPSIAATLKWSDGSAVNLTGATVKFTMKKGNTIIVNEAAVTIVDAATGSVRYDWVAADTKQTGICKGEFEVTFSDGKICSFPSKGDLKIIFREEYA